MKKNKLIAVLVFLAIILVIVIKPWEGKNAILINSSPTIDTLITENYSKDDLRTIYEDIRKSSFEDTYDETELIFKYVKGGFAYSSPFNLNLYINIDEINRYNWPEDAVRGLFAHELSHMVSYKRRSFMGRMLFIWNYPFSESTRAKVDREADEIAIERGYGEELIQERIYQFDIDDVERREKEMRVYLSVEALEKLVREKK